MTSLDPDEVWHVPDCRQDFSGIVLGASEPLPKLLQQIYSHLASLEHSLCGASVAVRGLPMLSADRELDTMLREEVKL